MRDHYDDQDKTEDSSPDESSIKNNTTYKPQKPLNPPSDFMLRPSAMPSKDSGDEESLRDSEVKIDAEKVVIEGEIEGLEKEAPPPRDPQQQAGPPMRQPSAGDLPPEGLGAAGPLTVDSVGDYLEDHSPEKWQEIDEAARKRAEETRQQQIDRANEQKNARDDANDARAAGRKAGQEERNKRKARKWQAQNPGVPLPQGLSDLPGVKDDAEFEDPAMLGQNRVAPNLPDKQESLVPQGQPLTEEQQRKQREFDLADYGSQGPSSFDIPGQASTAKEDAVDKAADSINTATGRIVDMLEGLAQVMNNHSNRIAQLEDTLDMESERDG